MRTGLMGSILADQVLNYRIVKQPWRELIKLLLTMVLLFCIGLLPFLDNWAHIGSFIVGFVT